MNPDDLVLERTFLELMQQAVPIREARIANCQVPGNITAAVRGESIVTVIWT